MTDEFNVQELTPLLASVISSRKQLNSARSRKDEIFGATKAINTVTLGKNPAVKSVKADLSQAVKDAEKDLELAGNDLRTYVSGLDNYHFPEIRVTQEETERGWDAQTPGYAVSVSVQGFNAFDRSSLRGAVTLLNILNYFSTTDLERTPPSSEKLARELDVSSAVISSVGSPYEHDSQLVIDQMSQEEFKIFFKFSWGTRNLSSDQANGAIYNMHALSKRLHDRGIDLEIKYDYVPLSD